MNLLVIQFRQDITKQHEQECINRYAKSEDNFTFVDIFDESSDSLFKNPKELLAGIDAVILGGSAGISMGFGHVENNYNHVNFIITKLQPISDYITKNDFPTLGVCFGHQLLADYLGSKVVFDKSQAETGFAMLKLTDHSKEDKIFSQLSTSFYGVVGHQDSVDKIPDSSILLASSEACTVQAFRYKNNIYGTQFHSELSEKDLIYRLNLFPVYKEYAKQMKTEDSSEATKILSLFLNYYRKNK